MLSFSGTCRSKVCNVRCGSEEYKEQEKKTEENQSNLASRKKNDVLNKAGKKISYPVCDNIV